MCLSAERCERRYAANHSHARDLAVPVVGASAGTAVRMFEQIAERSVCREAFSDQVEKMHEWRARVRSSGLKPRGTPRRGVTASRLAAITAMR